MIYCKHLEEELTSYDGPDVHGEEGVWSQITNRIKSNQIKY